MLTPETIKECVLQGGDEEAGPGEICNSTEYLIQYSLMFYDYGLAINFKLFTYHKREAVVAANTKKTNK